MALPITLSFKVKAVGAAGTAGGDSREHVLLEPVGGDGTIANGGPIRLVIDDATKQGLFSVDQTVAVRFT